MELLFYRKEAFGIAYDYVTFPMCDKECVPADLKMVQLWRMCANQDVVTTPPSESRLTQWDC
ncbi:hypothetical protein CTI12_AA118530 [Artemisia annua]|uniref:Uncharacterized protein n=1 Tax=Artemisia annua TaxID=35608 RepID=A0A2U1PSA2_ARTAN|nr:hypothetical protein CTI12_AA118530 [Artemisia annua]